MPFCPGCGSEFKVGIKECPDCELPLRVAPLLDDLEIDSEREYSVVFMTGNSTQAGLISGFLAESGIKSTVIDRMAALRSIYGLHSLSDDTQQVIVLKEDEERAKKILDENVGWSEDELAAYMKRTGELEQSDEPIPKDEENDWRTI